MQDSGIVGQISGSMQTTINEFVIAIFRVNAQIDRIRRAHDPTERATALRQARESYGELARRQHTLTLSLEDAFTIEMMMQSVRVRMKYLRYRSNRKTEGAPFKFP